MKKSARQWSVSANFWVVVICIVVSACGGSPRQTPVKDVPVESSEPAVQTYALEEAEISGEELTTEGTSLELLQVETATDGQLPLGVLPDGIIVSLSDYPQNVVIVNYWSSNCDACLQVMVDLDRMYKQYASSGLVVLNVGLGESRKAVDAYLRTNALSLGFTQLTDPSGTLSRSAGINRSPAAVLYRNQEEVARYLTTVDVARISQDVGLLLN